MHDFTFYNPVNIIFGKNRIEELANLIPNGSRVLLAYGGGSIKQNNVYDRTIKALSGFYVSEFGGIEANPDFDTLTQAIEICKTDKINFILAVGGGSVIDGVKLIAVAVNYPQDPWCILEGKTGLITNPIKFGTILTLPATGSEMNNGSVISRRRTQEKKVFTSDHAYPVFSILEPEVTYSLPKRQLTNGIVDPFIHVTEQYLTTNLHAAIQDGFAESILKTLIEVAPKIISGDKDYTVRSNWMWAATNALNGLIGIGVDHDWSTHCIGHALTNIYGLDHAQTLALIAPQVWRFKKEQKKAKLLQFAKNVWNIDNSNPDVAIEDAIVKTEQFFKSIGMHGTISQYGIDLDVDLVSSVVVKDSGDILGEHKDIRLAQIKQILEMAR